MIHELFGIQDWLPAAVDGHGVSPPRILMWKSLGFDQSDDWSPSRMSRGMGLTFKVPGLGAIAASVVSVAGNTDQTPSMPSPALVSEGWTTANGRAEPSTAYRIN